MEPSALRYAILRLLDQHEETGNAPYLEDVEIAPKLSVPLTRIQKQLLILESRGLVALAKTMGPTYGARLTAGGMEAIESLAQ